MGLCFALAAQTVALVGPSVRHAAAASVASTGANDTARCVAGKVGNVGAALCYYDQGAFPNVQAFAGQTLTYASTTYSSYPTVSGQFTTPGPNGTYLTSPAAYDIGDPLCGWSGAGTTTANGAKIYMGPQTYAGSVVIPSGGFLVECIGSQWHATLTLNSVSQSAHTFSSGPAYAAVNVCNPAAIGSCGSGNQMRANVFRWGYGVQSTFGAFASAAAGGSLPANWFPSGAAFSTIDPFCGATVTDTWTGATGTNRLETVIEPGDRVPFLTTGTVGLTKRVDVFWHGPAFTSPYPEDYIAHQIWTDGSLPTNPQTSGVDGTGGLRVEMRPNVTPIKLGDVTLRCETQAGLIFYKKLREVSVADLHPPDSNTACEHLKLYWPARVPLDPTYAVGDTPQFQISYSGALAAGVSDSILSFKYTTINHGSGSSPVADSARTWTAVTFVTSGYSYPLHIPTQATISTTAGYVGGLDQFRFRCEDAAGYHYIGVPAIVQAVLTEQSCLEQSGLGWAPSSWVPGAVRMGSCILRVLFVPSQAALDDLTGAAGAALTHAPFSFVAEGIEIVVDAYDALDEAVDSSSSSCFVGVGGGVAPNSTTGEINEVEVCSSDFPTGFGIMRAFLVWLFWLGFAWMIFADTLRVFT